MASKITGAVKFFNRNFALSKLGTVAAASSNEDAIKRILDISRYTEWQSLGSSDIVEEVIVVTFSRAKAIDSLFLVDMNFKEFTVKYDSGGSFIDFTNVGGVNNKQKVNISETDYSRGTAFYQFDQVTTSSIEIRCLKTQTADDQKRLTQFIASLEIGTLQGFPRVRGMSSRNESNSKTLSRRVITQKTYETNQVDINFKSHALPNDIGIIDTLFDREDPFLIYPCGGRAGSEAFTVTQRNWRLEDIYNVQFTGKMRNEYEKGVYLLGANKAVKFQEHV